MRLGKFFRIFLVSILSTTFMAMLCQAKEIGDVRYEVGFQTWGHRDASIPYDFPNIIGHGLIYAGTDENGVDWFIEAWPPDVQMAKNSDRRGGPAPLDGNFYHFNFTNSDRRSAVAFCRSKVGAGYPTPSKSLFGPNVPSVNQQKGSAGKFSCVGLVEKAYENASVDITPNGTGRNLEDSTSTLFSNWNEKEGSIVGAMTSILGISVRVKGEVFFPYTQWYKQTTASNPNDDVQRMSASSSANPTITINKPSSGQKVFHEYEVISQAEDGSNGSGIFKVEYYNKSISPSNLLENHKLSVDASGLVDPIPLSELKSSKIYTYGSPDGSTKPRQEILPSGEIIRYIFYYKDNSVPIELSEYKFKWNTRAHKNSTPTVSLDAQLNKEAKIKDGKTTLHAKAWDRAGNTRTTDVGNVIIDNFMPYVEKVEVKQAGNTKYKGEWIPQDLDGDGASENLTMDQPGEKNRTDGIVGPTSDAEVIITFSEAMKPGSIVVTLNPAGQILSGNLSSDGLTYTATISKQDICDGVYDGQQTIEIEGEDEGDNDLRKQDFVDPVSDFSAMQIQKQTNGTFGGTPQGADKLHRIWVARLVIDGYFSKSSGDIVVGDVDVDIKGLNGDWEITYKLNGSSMDADPAVPVTPPSSMVKWHSKQKQGTAAVDDIDATLPWDAKYPESEDNEISSSVKNIVWGKTFDPGPGVMAIEKGSGNEVCPFENSDGVSKVLKPDNFRPMLMKMTAEQSFGPNPKYEGEWEAHDLDGDGTEETLQMKEPDRDIRNKERIDYKKAVTLTLTFSEKMSVINSVEFKDKTVVEQSLVDDVWTGELEKDDAEKLGIGEFYTVTVDAEDHGENQLLEVASNSDINAEDELSRDPSTGEFKPNGGTDKVHEVKIKTRHRLIVIDHSKSTKDVLSGFQAGATEILNEQINESEFFEKLSVVGFDGSTSDEFVGADNTISITDHSTEQTDADNAINGLATTSGTDIAAAFDRAYTLFDEIETLEEDISEKCVYFYSDFFEVPGTESPWESAGEQVASRGWCGPWVDPPMDFMTDEKLTGFRQFAEAAGGGVFGHSGFGRPFGHDAAEIAALTRLMLLEESMAGQFLANEAVSEGTLTKTVLIDESVSEVLFFINGKGGAFIEVTDPTGALVDGLYPGGEVIEAFSSFAIRVSNPKAGNWTVTAFAESPSTSLRVVIRTGFQLITEVPRHPLGATSVPFLVRATGPDSLRLGLSMKADIKKEVARFTYSPFATFELFDDGAHGDSGANDGIYANDLPVPNGQYLFEITANGNTPLGIVKRVKKELVITRDLPPFIGVPLFDFGSKGTPSRARVFVRDDNDVSNYGMELKIGDQTVPLTATKRSTFRAEFAGSSILDIEEGTYEMVIRVFDVTTGVTIREDRGRRVTRDFPLSESVLFTKVRLGGVEPSFIEGVALRDGIDLSGDYRLTNIDGPAAQYFKEKNLRYFSDISLIVDTTLTLAAGERLRIHWDKNLDNPVTEVDFVGDRDQNGVRDIYVPVIREIVGPPFRPRLSVRFAISAPGHTDAIALTRGFAIIDAVAWDKGKVGAASAAQEVADVVFLESRGEWIGSPVSAFSFLEGVPLVRLEGRETNRAEDWAVSMADTAVVSDIQAGEIVINEVGPRSAPDFVELRNVSTRTLDMSTLQITNVSRTLAPLSVIPVFVNPGAVVVAHLEPGQNEHTANDDLNGNGVQDVYLDGMTGLFSTDDQVLLMTTDARILDAVTWTNGDLDISKAEFKDLDFLTKTGQWPSSVSNFDQNPSVPVGWFGHSIERISSSDNNTKNDWTLQFAPTPGRQNNSTYRFPKKGDVVINEVFIGESNTQSWAELKVLGGPIDISGLILNDARIGETDLTGMHILADTAFTVQTGEFVVVYFDTGVSEIDSLGDANHNGYREIYHPDQANLTKGLDNMLVLRAGGDIVDVVIWSNGDDRSISDDVGRLKKPIDVGEWNTGFGFTTDSGTVGYTNRITSVGRGIGAADRNHFTDWIIQRSPTPGVENNTALRPKIVVLSNNSPFSPNGDGTKEHWELVYSILDESGSDYGVKVDLIDAVTGNRLKNLSTFVARVSDTFVVTWDGRDENEEIVRDGDYIASIIVDNSLAPDTVTLSLPIRLDTLRPGSPVIDTVSSPTRFKTLKVSGVAEKGSTVTIFNNGGVETNVLANQILPEIGKTFDFEDGLQGWMAFDFWWKWQNGSIVGDTSFSSTRYLFINAAQTGIVPDSHPLFQMKFRAAGVGNIYLFWRGLWFSGFVRIPVETNGGEQTFIVDMSQQENWFGSTDLTHFEIGFQISSFFDQHGLPTFITIDDIAFLSASEDSAIFVAENIGLDEGENILTALSTDAAENEGPVSSAVQVVVDSLPPTTTLEVIGPHEALPTGEIRAGPETLFRLMAVDTGVGGDTTFVDTGEGQREVQSPGTLVFRNDGIYSLSFFSVDKIGNEEALHAVTVIIVSHVEDTEPPKISIVSVNSPTNQNVTLQISVTDNITPSQRIVITGDASPYTTEGVHNVTIVARDEAGNTVAAAVSFTIDKIPPGFIRFSPSGGETFVAKRDTIVISIEAKDAFDPDPIVFAQLAHFVGTTSDTAITVVDSRQIAPLSIPAGQWKLLATAKDAAGNIRTQEGGFFTVIHDALPPRTALTVGDPKFVRNSDSAAYITAATPLMFAAVDDLVTVGDSGGLGVAKIEVSVNGGVFTVVTGPLALAGLGEGKHTVSYRATDAVGNVEATRTATLYIDATAPVTTDSKTPAANKNGWNAADVSVSLSAADPALSDGSNSGSGVKETRLGVDGATPTTHTTATTVSTEGIHPLAFFSVDNIGNTEAIRSDTVRIDKTAPAVVSNRSPQANNNGWNRDPVFVSYTATDALSGVDTSTSDLETDVLSLEAAGQSASAVAVDLAGNTTTVTVTNLNIDSTPPIITTTRSPSPNLNGWHNTSVTVAFSETDSLSGIDTSASDVTLLSEGFSQSALGFAVDLAGNTTSVTISGIHIDLTNPVITADALPPANINGWRNTAVTITFTETDALSGIDTPAQDVEVSTEGAGQAAFGFAVDLAGNTATASVSGINIDFTAPALSVQPITPDSTGFGLDGRSWWKSPVTIAFSATDALSGLDVSRTALTFMLPNEGKDQGVTGIAVDEADNTSTLAVTGINIDFTAPQTALAIGEPQVVDGQTFVTGATPFTLTAADTLSGVAQTEFRLEEGGAFAPGVSFTIPAPEGIRSVGFRSTDVSGNVESEKTIEIVLDNTAPATTLAVDITDTTGTVLIPQSEITLTSVDGPALTPAVGVDRIEYQIDGGAAQVYSGAFGVSALGPHTLTYRAFDRLGNAEPVQTFNFVVSPALSASKFVSFAPRVLVWLNDESGKEDDDDEDEKDKGIPAANVSVLKSILDSAPILLYDLVENPDSFIALMRTDSYNVYLIVGDEEDLDKEREWELSERVRMGDGLISSFLDEIDLPVHDKGEHEGKDKDDDEGDDKGKSGDDHGKGKEDDHDKDNKAAKNLLGVDVDGKHSDKNIKISLTGVAIPFTGEYQTTDKTKRVRAMASTAVGDGFVAPNGKDKELEATAVSNTFGDGKTVFFSFDVGLSATPVNSGPTEQLLNAAIKKVTPTTEVFIPDGRTVIGIGVQSKVVPLNLAVRIEEVIPAGASVVNKLGGDVQGNAVIWNLSLDVNEVDTVQYMLGLPDVGEAGVTTSADVSYIVRGRYILFDTLKLTIVTEKDLPNLLDQAISQLNALNPTDKDDQDKVEDAVEELQKLKASPPATDKKIEDAIEEILEIIRDLDGVEADVEKLSEIRDTLDKGLMLYERQFSK